MAVDPERDLVFVPTGSASPDYYGGLRPGDDKWANSVVALDPDGSVATTLTVGARPVAAVAAAGSLWVANLDDREYYDRISHRGEPFDLAVSRWWDNNTDPAQDLQIFDGRTIGADANQDFSYLNDPAFDRQLHAAAALSGAGRYRAYRQLALELERDLAPAATFATTASRDFFSARMGCQLDQPLYGIDLAALCLRSTGN